MQAISQQAQQLTLRLYVQPKASRDQWLGLHNGELKLAITAPPVDGKANAHVIKFIAKQCKVSKSRVVLLKGHSSRHKVVCVDNPIILPDALKALL
ncbi:DUF167 family protein [Paraferrimonas haliotis]|uniref:DUF167 family protein n=1 Tax=Paraferrimonas haliotis TaxID=2013866 RepID=UPI000BA8DA06|nr:DUF167 family protein [Paraferrimonas haliotis]